MTRKRSKFQVLEWSARPDIRYSELEVDCPAMLIVVNGYLVLRISAGRDRGETGCSLVTELGREHAFRLRGPF